MSFETISVIGLGYIGLPTAAILASRKKKVIGVDINQEAVDIINKGDIHIVEPDLDIVVHSSVTEGYLRATTKPEPADAFIIAVPTPFKGDHQPDLSFIEKASEAISPVLKQGNLVILESTSPIGTTEKMARWIERARPDLSVPGDVSVAHCPERVLPGHVMQELIQNGRVVGGLTSECSRRAVELYNIFVQGECLVTDARTAEMVKLTENAFRDVNIAFANELSAICDEQDIDVWELRNLANKHPRVNILQPGPGVGGHCIAVDPWFIVSSNPEEAILIRQARLVNDAKPSLVLKHAMDEINKFNKTRPSVACMGLAFKPNIDDMRESPAMQIVGQLKDTTDANLLVIEPNIKYLPESLADLELVDLISGVRKADIVLFLVAHSEFFGITKTELQGKIVLDPCGVTSNYR